MRINELKEQSKILETLSKDCGPFLNKIGNNIPKYLLYRGMKRTTKNVVIQQARLVGRRTLNTKEDKHKQMNQYFIDRFGEPFRDAVFVTGDQNEAEKYGVARIIFPIGEFSFVWSPKIKDTSLDVRWPKTFGYDIGATQEQVDEIFDRYEYRNTDLKQAISSGNEIMLRCERYYALSQNFVAKELL